jgi:hypothetical protein
MVSGESGNVTVTWSANGASGTANGGQSWQASVPLVPGANTIRITAVDASGQTDTTSFLTTRTQAVSLPAWSEPPQQPTPAAAGSADDRVAPTLAITAPGASVFVTSNSTARISGTARDNGGLREITWESGSGSGTAEGTSMWVAAVPLLMGDNSVIIRARDEAGNTSWRSLLIVRR